MPSVRQAVVGYALQQLYNRLDKIHHCRGQLVEHMLAHWWPAHRIIWINNYEDYLRIEQTLDQAHSPVLIAQTEEDWFLSLDWHDVRQRIKQHPNWCDRSMIISNSRWDCDMLSSVGIQNQCKPGLLDLMTYRELPEVIWQADLVQHHTSVMFARMTWPGNGVQWPEDTGRTRLCQLLMDNQDRVGCILAASAVLDNQPEVAAQCVLPDGPQDCPNIPLAADHYLRTIAFSAVLETQYRGHWCPTTSEKTYRCFHNQVPALVCAGQHTRRYLMGLGFDPCDWLFDWSWDTEPDPDTRFQGFLTEIQRQLARPLDQLLRLIDINRSSLEHNQHNVRRLIYNYDRIDNRTW